MKKTARESFEDQVSRLRMMASGNSKWDLSDNDIEAIKAALAIIDKTTTELHVICRALVDAFHEEQNFDGSKIDESSAWYEKKKVINEIVNQLDKYLKAYSLRGFVLRSRHR